MVEDAIIIPPVYLGPGAVVRRAVVGPHVSVGDKSVIEDSIVSNSIVQASTTISGAVITNSLLGSYVRYAGHPADLSLGDYTTLAE